MATQITMNEDSSAWSDLLQALDDLTTDKYSRKFCTFSANYRFRGDEALRVDVLIPLELMSRQFTAPVIVRIHGGFLVTGSSLYPPWFGGWILDYAIRHNAIIVSPDYRLLPEVNGYDIMEDMSVFWSWLHDGKVNDLMRENGQGCLKVDLTKLLLVGESAGGYLATQLALSHFSDVKALIALYPMLDLKSTFYTTEYPKPIMRVSNRPNSVIDDHLSTQRSWRSHSDPPERLELAFAIVQNGRFLEFFSPSDRDPGLPSLYPMDRLDHGQDADGQSEGSNLPEIFIFHGKQDSAVPVESSYVFVQKLKERRRNVRVNLYVQDGDHGFDFDATLKTPWLTKGLEPITAAWLNCITSV